ncbi:ribosomal protein L7/L12 [Actinophytocola glycyrrhizae]|uniref:Ribosomal protein L7/L12 n=1 Tax=Actinophytocola glycyrrhizae TaxID=2044873 RepID=A0ABV9RWP9_9PSEU
MSTGTQILLGVAAAVVLFSGWLALRRRTPAERRPASGDLDARLAELVADGKTVLAIRELRRETGMGLREAKEHVLGLTPQPRRRVTDRVGALLADGRKIQAIKELREQTGMGLREAKDYVDAMESAGEPPAPRPAEVDEETMARARELVAAGETVRAVKLARRPAGASSTPRTSWTGSSGGASVPRSRWLIP